jgi:hypothetical protein
MFNVGALVRDIDDNSMIGIVVGQQGTVDRWYVKWLTGYWQGQTTSRWDNCLEEICE